VGRILAALVKTVLAVVIAVGTVIASFYLAYLILVLILICSVGAIAWHYFMKEDKIDWFEYED
jgi:hypothetical protein